LGVGGVAGGDIGVMGELKDGDERREGERAGWDARSVGMSACFGAVTLALSVPLLAVMLLISPLVYVLDRDQRRAHHALSRVWAKWSTWLFYKTTVSGAGEEESRLLGGSLAFPPVVVANHQSYLDVYALLHLRCPFKFVSKQSIFFVPLIGPAMFLTGHVMLRRRDKTGRSQAAMMTRCRTLLTRGVPVCIFPEGTRSSTGCVGGFKLGAFKLACDTGAPVVPVTICGTRRGLLGAVSSGVVVTVHPLIRPEMCGSDPAELARLARAAVVSGLKAG